MTAVVVGLGGVFAWRGSYVFRSRAPHVTISHEISHRFIGNGYLHIAVTSVLHNSSRVNIEFLNGYSRIQRIAPALDEYIEQKYVETFVKQEHGYIQWTTLDDYRHDWDKGAFSIEPRETGTEIFEFVVSSELESVMITTYFYNSRVVGKVADDIDVRDAPRLKRRWWRWLEVKGSRGWDRTTVYDILRNEALP